MTTGQLIAPSRFEEMVAAVSMFAYELKLIGNKSRVDIL